MKKGRPPKTPTGPTSTITIKIPTTTKQHILTMADAYDLTITDYLLTLVQRDTDAQTTPPNPHP